ncbi:MAG: type II toxin-antitoxin system RelE/ParE family toxin [Mesorhizobium sp.]|uniref:type II toxin-antitoxin system RelE/ParE family toxin n=1 Tax=Mesorhizobium sp. TaxID=1871066 RepID=UPI000FE816D6|nr:type II toxin-antitoxin system RelE/ParE family toxin [Mesorhizobium sp.]RWF83380.1 MAG: type II toxin-antitoxin system RelE/ParE family toxin [Mesorhizobium sp.]RWF87766.1 MAG: type II toxin-antitoxin system RelE/ParE family toxin [Mesorhizobium sp.]
MKALGWIGTAKADLLAFPDDVVREVGHALFIAQSGGEHADAKPLRGFGGASVPEIVEDHDGDTYRAVYTVRFAEVIYVLHAFQKKSKKGIATPPQEIDKVKARLKRAEEEYQAWKRKKP